MTHRISILFVSVFQIVFGDIAFQKSCDTRDTPGRCVYMWECHQSIDLLNQRLNPGVIDLLRKSSCGFHYSKPKLRHRVCCPSESTDGENILTEYIYYITRLPPLPEYGNSNTSSSTTSGGVDTVLDDSCETVDKGRGRCVRIMECEQSLELVRQARSNSEARDLLRQSLCGYDNSCPKVCCPIKHTQATTSSSVTDREKPLLTDNTDYISAFPSPPECGISNASFGGIVGGVDAELGDLPWMALLGYAERSGLTNWLCGGSLISARHVLTAAHCIHNQEASLYVVRLGELDLDREHEGATPVDVPIKSKIKHEAYNPQSYENDIGLLVLQNDVRFTDLIRPICLPMETSPRSVMNFLSWTPLVAEWGNLRTRGTKATYVQVLQLPLLNNEVCAQSYSAYEARIIDHRVICAGYTSSERDSCSGDSGGPLMKTVPVDMTSAYYQLGVVAFGPPECALPGLPGIYTRISSFRPWLKRNVLGSL